MENVEVNSESISGTDSGSEPFSFGDADAAEKAQYARTVVKIYEADGLPKLNAGILASVKKAFSRDICDLLETYVEVQFSNLKGCTSKKKNTPTPCWNEQIVFTTVFPIPGNKVVLKLVDGYLLSNAAIGESSITLDEISNLENEGFLPTFGPCYLHFYESDSEERHSYKGKLLMAISTEIADSIQTMKPPVAVEQTPPLSKESIGHQLEFFLFGCLREVSMIDKKVGDKTLMNIAISIGNEGFNEDEENFDASFSTPPVLPKPTNDRRYSCLPLEEEKPCVWIKSSWLDQRRQMYHANVISKLSKMLNSHLTVIRRSLSLNCPHAESSFEKTIRDLETTATECYSILKIFLSSTTRTNLEKEKSKFQMKELEQFITELKDIKCQQGKGKEEYHLNRLKQIHRRIDISKSTNHDLPDVIVWMVRDSKRVGYVRIAARDLIFSTEVLECGKHSGQVRTFFLKPFQKRSTIEAVDVAVAKIEIFLWLGLMRQLDHCYQMLPKGYDSFGVEESDSPPKFLRYASKQYFELKSHLYQARFLTDAQFDHNPSPFARVFFADICRSTQVADDTLHPAWDEMLSSQVVFFGDETDIGESPPLILIEFYDHSTHGKSKLMGRTSTFPLVKLRSEPYSAPKFPPTLQWFDVHFGSSVSGRLLAVFELLQVSEGETLIYDADEHAEKGPVVPIPEAIRPVLSTWRLEVLFWGLRNLKRVNFRSLKEPRVDVSFSGAVLKSTPIPDYRSNPNFSDGTLCVDLDLPDQVTFWPPLTISLVDCKGFGRTAVVATHIVDSFHEYLFRPIIYDDEPRYRMSLKDVLLDIEVGDGDAGNSFALLTSDIPWTTKRESCSISVDQEEEAEEEDWWSRYYASCEELSQVNALGFPYYVAIGEMGFEAQRSGTVAELRTVSRELSQAVNFYRKFSTKNELLRKPHSGFSFTIFPCELENVPEFGGFREWLHSFELTRTPSFAKSVIKRKRKAVGVFKGCFRAYTTPLLPNLIDPVLPVRSSQESVFQGVPTNEPHRVLVRVYIIKAVDLSPADVDNTADPYVVLQVGKQIISDKENYVSNQLNPTFGKCFEFSSVFPRDASLVVQIFDWDLVGSDDLIGETKIDLENRFYSRHRPGCGLARTYETTGPNAWRDAFTPSQILTKLCRENQLEEPHFTGEHIRIGRNIYDFRSSIPGETPTVENMSLSLLHQWQNISPANYHLTPEHVETRTLYHPSKPGQPQGKLEMWVDIFSKDENPPLISRDISPRKPTSFELRVIVWNTDEVILADDSYFTGEKMSDIYVKGWITGKEDTQCTDVHYRSLTGEGNFNWRFVFPFDYLPVEKKIVVRKKSSLLSWDDTEFKIPPELHLEVWDADHFSADECLGSLTLDLNRSPRGSKTSKSCTLDMLTDDGTVPQVSLFRQRRIRGWWPFSNGGGDAHNYQLTGKLEAEFQLLTKEEADENPAGLGRKEPEPLEPPDRPETSFLPFMHPWKVLRYTIWGNFKGTIVKGIAFAMLVLIFVLFVYAIPGYTVKKILGA